MKWNWKEWLKAAAIRAVRTFAQTFASMIAVGAAFSEIDWLRALSVSGTALILSFAMSLGGLPELKTEEEKEQQSEPPDESEEEE